MNFDLWDGLMVGGVAAIALGAGLCSIPFALLTVGVIALAAGAYGATR